MNNLLAQGSYGGAPSESFDLGALEAEIESQTDIPTFTSLGQLISQGNTLSVTTLIFFIAGALLAFYLIYGGIHMMTSAGEPKKIAEGRQIITNALLGMFIVIFAYWIVQIMGALLALPGFQNTF